jgi:peptide/nickel transport system ATP-binding protein/oligopeptide transport system ATP-binding protein
MTSTSPTARSDAVPVLQVDELHTHFIVRNVAGASSKVRAVDGVSFRILPKETLAIVGESGCGKSTVGRTAMRLVEPTSGRILLNGVDITAASPRQMRPLRRTVQMVFQDPYSSLDPRMTAGDAIAEPLVIHRIVHGAELKKRVLELMQRVGLKPDQVDRYPHEFSGGQRQRIGIARALALNPSLIIADEPVSALDVSIQAQVLNLLVDLQQELGLSYLFISHDLAVVRHVSDRVAVMYLGRIVETAATDQLFAQPMHPYTDALLAAAPAAHGASQELQTLNGEVPDPAIQTQGCAFRTRCLYAQNRCSVEEPLLREVTPGRFAACHFSPEWRRGNNSHKP